MTNYTKHLVEQMPMLSPDDLWTIIEAAQAQLKAQQELEDGLSDHPELKKSLFRRMEALEQGEVQAKPWREAMADIRKKLGAST